MKNTKFILALILVAALGANLFGCTEKDNTTADRHSTDRPTAEAPADRPEAAVLTVKPAKLIAPDYDEDSEAEQTAARGANEFAFRLSEALSKTEAAKTGEGENFVCSPFSVYLPLAALLNATDDANKAVLIDSLGAYGLSESDINRAASRMLYDLTSLPSNIESVDKDFKPLQIANAIFVDDSSTLNIDFAQTFADYYRGAAFNVDFKSKEAVDIVNKWAGDNTNGLIDHIIEEFDPNTVAAIANAIYFSDRWSWEFNKEKTKEGVFNAPDGETTADFMLRESYQHYYEDEQVQAVRLDFITGGGLYILLPKDGDAAGLLRGMDGERFEQLRYMNKSDGTLKLPKFEIESDVMDLNDALISLGVPLFEGAPLNGVVKEGSPLQISSAAQKALIKVDEEGTTAAAVTVMTMAGVMMPEPTTPFEMICDRPFVFVLCGETHDGGAQVLFTGVVNRP